MKKSIVNASEDYRTQGVSRAWHSLKQILFADEENVSHESCTSHDPLPRFRTGRLATEDETKSFYYSWKQKKSKIENSRSTFFSVPRLQVRLSNMKGTPVRLSELQASLQRTLLRFGGGLCDLACIPVNVFERRHSFDYDTTHRCKHKES